MAFLGDKSTCWLDQVIEDLYDNFRAELQPVEYMDGEMVQSSDGFELCY